MMERIGGEVRRSLGGAGVPDAGVLAAVVDAWPDAVGPAIARSAWPSRIGRDGTLHVATVSATWAFELGHLAGEIQAKLAAAVGPDAPSALRFSPGPVPAAGAEEEGDPVPPRPSAEEEREADAIACGVDDERLRELVRRAAAASLAARRSDHSF